MNTANIPVLLWHRSKQDGESSDGAPTHFVSASGRRFERVIDTDSGMIFVFELVPNGRCVEVDASGHVIRSWEEPRLSEWQNDPSTLYQRAKDAGLVDSLVLTGAAIDQYSTLYPSVAGADKAVMEAIEGNYFLDSRAGAPESDTHNSSSLVGDLINRIQHLQSSGQRIQESLDYAPSLLKGVAPPDASNLRHVHCCLLAFYNAPRAATWKRLAECALFPDATSALNLWVIHDDDAPRMAPLGGAYDTHPSPEDFFAWLRDESAYQLNHHLRLAEDAQNELFALKNSHLGMA